MKALEQIKDELVVEFRSRTERDNVADGYAGRDLKDITDIEVRAYKRGLNEALTTLRDMVPEFDLSYAKSISNGEPQFESDRVIKKLVAQCEQMSVALGALKAEVVRTEEQNVRLREMSELETVKLLRTEIAQLKERLESERSTSERFWDDRCKFADEADKFETTIIKQRQLLAECETSLEVAKVFNPNMISRDLIDMHDKLKSHLEVK